MSEVLHQCVAKATTAEGENVRHSLNWVIAQRGRLRVTSEALEFRSWRIPYSSIDEAVLFRVRQMFIPGYVLRVRSGNRVYQFGVHANRFWEGPLPFPVGRESARLRYSLFSTALRVILVGLLAYLAWKALS